MQIMTQILLMATLLSLSLCIILFVLSLFSLLVGFIYQDSNKKQRVFKLAKKSFLGFLFLFAIGFGSCFVGFQLEGGMQSVFPHPIE